MQARQISHLLFTDPYTGPIFRGVFPIDRLPEIHYYPAILVVNLDPHDKPGSHWVALFFDKNKHCEFFNSYGVEPCQTLKTYIAQHSVSSSHNEKQVQQFMTHTCGQFCIFYLVWRSREVPMKTVIGSLDKKSADQVVTNFVNTLFNINTKIFDLKFFSL